MKTSSPCYGGSDIKVRVILNVLKQIQSIVQNSWTCRSFVFVYATVTPPPPGYTRAIKRTIILGVHGMSPD